MVQGFFINKMYIKHAKSTEERFTMPGDERLNSRPACRHCLVNLDDTETNQNIQSNIRSLTNSPPFGLDL